MLRRMFAKKESPLGPEEQILLRGSNLWYLGEGMLGPLFAAFAERVGGDVLDITWAWAAYLIVTGLGIMFVGQWSDTKARKEILLVAGYYLNAIFTFSYLFVQNPVHLLLVQVGLAISVALATPTWNALYAKKSKAHEQSGFVWGMADGQANVVTGIAIVIGGLIVHMWSFDVLFVVMGLVQFVAATYQAKILKLERG